MSKEQLLVPDRTGLVNNTDLHLREVGETKSITDKLVEKIRGTLNLTPEQEEELARKQQEINMSKVKDPKNLNFKKCKIAEHMVASRHPLC